MAKSLRLSPSVPGMESCDLLYSNLRCDVGVQVCPESVHLTNRFDHTFESLFGTVVFPRCHRVVGQAGTGTFAFVPYGEEGTVRAGEHSSTAKLV